MLHRLDLRGEPPGARVDVGTLRDGATADDREAEAVASVRDIIAAVRQRGDAALFEMTERFDGCRVDTLRLPADEITAALDACEVDLRDALTLAASRIRAYHEAQSAVPRVTLDRDGIRVEEVLRPVARAGLYVPGGRAAYPSTVLMTAIPARVAGVPSIALCVPPDRSGQVPAVTLAAAATAGVDEVYRVGGAQAIAALAYGTESIQPVDVVVGPGNRYVDIAKREVAGAGVVGIESPAGPSELVVIADAGAPVAAVAADLAAQAEHGPDGLAVLVTWHPEVAEAVRAALDGLAPEGPLRDALVAGGHVVLVRDPAHALAVANAVAPEHLELMVEEPDALVDAVRDAGAVFCGYHASTAMGDYVAGANHVLPTGGSARFASALRVDDFRKHVHVVHAGVEGAALAARVGGRIARAEGLTTHALSLDARLSQ